ncbi:MAG: InlB B-repeat-containing protein, partial [Clostridia bacterium]|nr:InlB B-repeat-containing protein [Clostridia bacterium]
DDLTAIDGQWFLNHGRYDCAIKRGLGADIKHTIFVDRREVNDAVVGYFGQSLFTPDSQRIYTTGEYPTYIAGKATWNLNATDGTVAPLVGELYKIDKDGKKIEESVKEIAQSYGADYKTKALQGTIDEVGTYKAEFWGNPKYLGNGDISGDLFHFTFTFEIVDKDTSTEPSINEEYLNGLLSFSDMQSKYYAVVMRTQGEGNAIFAFSDYSGAYDFAYEIERSKVNSKNGKYEYNGKTYTTQKAVLTAVDEIAKSHIVERYFDSTNPESYQTADVIDDKILEMNYMNDVVVFLNDDEQSYMQAGLPSLNGRKYRYVSESGEIEEGVMNFAFIKVADFESQSVTLTHKSTGKVYNILYGVSVEYQLGLENAPSGVYTVREENSNNSFSEYDVTYTRPGDMTGTATFSLFRGGKFVEKTFSKDNTVTESGLSGFVLKSLSNELDIYSIVKIDHNNITTIYTFDEVSDMWFSEGGVYNFTLADRLGNTVEFSVIISNPVGYADIYLQLEQEDEEITKYYHVFVGQEIVLPTPKPTSELYVFEGWLYEDELITDNLFTPPTGGTLYVWQQITQKYTYLNFDADGGESVERMKVEIGEPVQLPTTSKDGWTFGGWEYGGRVYDDEFTPTSASPTFVAIWNYQTSEIALYDGNLTQTIVAHVGDKVTLPFPTRTGYTFFGWRQEEDDNQNKVYYGQITALANIEYMRLDALWIRESNENFDALSNGTGGRTMIHFVDGDLLPNDSLQSVAGAVISTPNVTRAGYTFIGWIWKTTSTSGKIYSNSSMTVPADAGNKLVLQALWIAKPITVAQSANQNVATEKLSATVNTMPSSIQAALGGLISMLGLIVVMCLVYVVRRKGRAFDATMQTISPIYGRDAFADKQSIRQRRIRKYGGITLLTAFLLVVVITFLSAFGGWGNLGVFQKVNNDINVTPVQSETVNNNVIGSTFGLDNNGAESEVKPSKDEVLGNIEDSGILDGADIDLTDEELFLYSLVMIDLYYYNQINVFPAVAVLPNKEEILGFGYTNYQEAYNAKDKGDDYIFYGAGFIAFPRQTLIENEDVGKGSELIQTSK